MQIWEEEVLKVTKHCHDAWQLRVAAFNATAEQHGIPAAIIWYGANVAQAEEIWRQVKNVHALMPDEAIPLVEKRKRLQAWLTEKRQSQMDGFELAATTSAFSNIVQNARTEARSQMWWGTGAFAKIERILKESETVQSAEAR